ncbi:cytochrome P450 6j1 [Anabrus simplex]|uniref:cytochrome P450 6j1 n=1 Tax=Anabrus simplex TaxID=316456 RepID=UPI0035A3882C
MVLDWLPLDWVTGVILALSLGYVYLVWNYDHWKKQGIVYEKPRLLFGSYKDVTFMKKAVGTLMHEIYNKHDGQPYIGLFRFRNPTLLVRDPEIIKTILVKDFPSFNKNGLVVDPELDPLFARSPFFSMGERWKHFRTTLSPGFTSGKLKTLFPLVEKTAKDLDKYLQTQARKNEPDGIETKELCCKYTTDVVASCVFGIEAGCFEDTKSEFLETNRKMFSQDVLTNIRILLTFFFPAFASLLKIRFMPTEVADFYRRIVSEVVTYRENKKETRNDFLQVLMQIKQKKQAALQEKADALGYSDEDLTGHAVTFIVEGIETSSIAMSFLLYELAMNPDAQEKLRQELEEAVEKNDGKFTYDIIHSLPYLNMVFTETLRMHPPLMTMEKFCTKRFELPKKSGGTMQVEPGTLILIPVHALQHDPKYFPEPERFDPERFSEQNKESIPKYTYLPFGEGPRVCLGMRFAQAQVKVAVAHVVLNYAIRPSPKTPKTIVQDSNYFLAAAQGGLCLNFVKRH